MIYYNNNWYLIPEYLFNLPSLTSTIYDIDANSLSDNLLPQYIKEIDIGDKVKYYNIANNNQSQNINILKINANYWENYWLDQLTNTNDIMLSNSLITLISYVGIINNNLSKIMYQQFHLYNYYNKYNEYFDFTTNNINEVQQYYMYKNQNNNTNLGFDVDIVAKYCNDNDLDFSLYLDNILPYNSLVILFMVNMLYADKDIIFSFWNKIQINNIIANAVPLTL